MGFGDEAIAGEAFDGAGGVGEGGAGEGEPLEGFDVGGGEHLDFVVGGRRWGDALATARIWALCDDACGAFPTEMAMSAAESIEFYEANMSFTMASGYAKY